MITTNLSTRPFYNAGAVTLAIAALAVVVGLASLFNVASIVRYTRSDSVLATQAAQDTERAAMLRAEATKLRASVDPRQVDLIATEARLANDLIDRRVFSWTELFNQFEATLPPAVRITAVRPNVDADGRINLTVNIASRSVDDINDFMENLEKTGAFSRLLAREERVDDNGELEATLEAVYHQARGRSAVAAGAPTPPVPAASVPSPATAPAPATERGR